MLRRDPRAPLKDANVLIRVGLVFLVAASLSRLFWHPSPGVPAGVVDGGLGLLYGISIGSLIMGLARKRRSRPLL
jgi:hypothetical protein